MSAPVTRADSTAPSANGESMSPTTMGKALKQAHLGAPAPGASAGELVQAPGIFGNLRRPVVFPDILEISTMTFLTAPASQLGPLAQIRTHRFGIGTRRERLERI